MSRYRVASGHGFSAIPLEQAEGKPIKGIHVSQAEDALNIDLQFQDNTSLELVFRTEFLVSATLLEYRNGNGHVIKKLKKA